ncbi:CopG family transcriptional regulator [bacterium]|nr:CopG family transcriptional regulator [bacterium]
MEKESKVTIKIPRHLYNQLKDLIENTGFSSVTDFMVWVMRDILAGGHLDNAEKLSGREIDLIRNRLKNLGYLE